MAVADNYIFLMDKYITKSVFVFDKQGRHKLAINRLGNGPGEYVALKDIFWDDKLHAIAIHCGMRKKLLYYNIQGQYLREQSLPFYTTRVLPLSNNFLMYCDYRDNKDLEERKFCPNVILTTPQGEVLSLADFYHKDMDDITAFYPILLKNNKMYFLLSIEDIFTAREYLEKNHLLPDTILDSVKEFDNPIIVAFTLKKF